MKKIIYSYLNLRKIDKIPVILRAFEREIQLSWTLQQYESGQYPSILQQYESGLYLSALQQYESGL